jgi:hypothetical protein
MRHVARHSRMDDNLASSGPVIRRRLFEPDLLVLCPETLAEVADRLCSPPGRTYPEIVAAMDGPARGGRANGRASGAGRRLVGICPAIFKFAGPYGRGAKNDNERHTRAHSCIPCRRCTYGTGRRAHPAPDRRRPSTICYQYANPPERLHFGLFISRNLLRPNIEV